MRTTAPSSRSNSYVAADPKPAPRIRNPDLLRILKFRLRECAVCGSTWDIHLHHVLYKSRRGDDVEANIAPLCEYHHRQIHAHDEITWRSLAVYVDQERPDIAAYLESKLGHSAHIYFANKP